MLAITVDIEDWYHVPAVTGSPFANFKDVDEFFLKWKDRYDYLTQPTMQVLEILDALKIRATFFVVADIVEHYPGLVEKIAAGGHEIACHGLHHACKIDPRTKKPMVTPTEFEARTLKAKNLLEKASGQPVIGYRSPAGYVSGWMLDSLEKIGFKYDSSVSVNSFYNKSDSHLKRVDSRPYYPQKEGLEPGKEKRAIIEFPWPYFKLGFKFPTGGGPLLRFFGARYILSGLKHSLKRGDTLFYFHPIDISHEKFPSVFSAKRPFYWAIKGKIVEKRIIYILNNVNAQVGTLQQILERKSKSDDIRAR